MALTHNSSLAKSEPSWGSVDKTKLPRNAHARMGSPDEKSSWGYPHHHVVSGKIGGKHGVYISGQMYLHRGGLRAALSVAGGARSGKKAESNVSTHLARHSNAIGMGKKETASLLGITISELYNLLGDAGGEKKMEIEQMEARIKELEALLAKKGEEDAVGDLNAKIETMQAELDEQGTKIDELLHQIEEYEKDSKFVTIGKDAIEATKAEIAKISAQIDGTDFNKDLLDKQLAAFGDDWADLKLFKESVEKKRAKFFKTGELNPDEKKDDKTKAQEDYELGQKLGQGNVVPIRK